MPKSAVRTPDGPITPALLSRQAAADMLGIGIPAMDELCRSGELQDLRIGARRLVTNASIHDFIERRIAVEYGED